MQTITVKPTNTAGWMVQHEQAEPMLFRSGAKAESSAKRLAQSLADVGLRTEVVIYLGDGSVAGRFISV